MKLVYFHNKKCKKNVKNKMGKNQIVMMCVDVIHVAFDICACH